MSNPRDLLDLAALSDPTDAHSLEELRAHLEDGGDMQPSPDELDVRPVCMRCRKRSTFGDMEWVNAHDDHLFVCLACRRELSGRPARGAAAMATEQQPMSDARLADQERVRAKVEVMSNGCWQWAGAISKKTGYGSISINGSSKLVHRVAYEAFVGPIPNGLVIDHLCRHRSCVNPAHLEPVTMRENVMRGIGPTAANSQKTHCINGHPFTEANLWISATGGRCCKMCSRLNRLRNEPQNHKYLTPADVEIIKQDLTEGLPQRTIAARRGVTQNTVSRIKRGAWKEHVRWTSPL